jgi:hypothetical protein
MKPPYAAIRGPQFSSSGGWKRATANGTATAGSDYVAGNGTLNFSAGQTSQPVTVQVSGDTAVESNETVLVNLSNPTGATLADSQGVGTIVNDDTAPQYLHVGDLDGSASLKKTTWTATVTITAHDAAHKIATSATVNAQWNDGSAASCSTGRTGTCRVSKTGIPTNTPSVSLTVQGLSKTGYSYNPASNHDPDGDSNGTTITVTK